MSKRTTRHAPSPTMWANGGGKVNPMLGACRSRTQKTGHLLHSLYSLEKPRTSNERVRKYIKKYLRRREAQNNGTSGESM